MDQLYKGEFPVGVLSGQLPLCSLEICTTATGVFEWLWEETGKVGELSVTHGRRAKEEEREKQKKKKKKKKKKKTRFQTLSSPSF